MTDGNWVTVVSTGFAPTTYRACEKSVAAQRGVALDHVVIDASKQMRPLTKIENLIAAIGKLPPNRVVALVDLDDKLTSSGALSAAMNWHAGGAWLTYGSFRYADGRPGFGGPYEAGESVRRSAWRLTHLKTFRAGLFQRIKPSDLMFKGKWIDRADDFAFMMPMAEMAGLDRCRYLREEHYEYNFAGSFEHTSTDEEKAHELAIATHVRKLRPYKRIETL
jgi:hypothetical protein